MPGNTEVVFIQYATGLLQHAVDYCECFGFLVSVLRLVALDICLSSAGLLDLISTGNWKETTANHAPSQYV